MCIKTNVDVTVGNLLITCSTVKYYGLHLVWISMLDAFFFFFFFFFFFHFFLSYCTVGKLH